MHTYFITRGIQQQRNLWVNGMSQVMFPWKRKNLQTGEWEYKLVQGALRPIELWEYVHPAECLPEVLAMQHKADGTGAIINEVHNLRPEVKNYALLMQKLLGLKPFPKFENTKQYGYVPAPGSPPFPVNWVTTDGFAVYPIGIKEDVFQDFPNFADANSNKGYWQEGL